MKVTRMLWNTASFYNYPFCKTARVFSLKKYFCTVSIILFLWSIGDAQQLPTHRFSNLLDKHLPDSHVALAGEVTFITYGAGIGFPVFWIEERLKIVPLVGVMWQNFISEGFQSRSATGLKMLYFFQSQMLNLSPENSFYSGIGGMTTIGDLIGSTANVYSRVGAILGYNIIISDRVQLAPELFFGINEAENLRVEIGFVIHFR